MDFDVLEFREFSGSDAPRDTVCSFRRISGTLKSIGATSISSSFSAILAAAAAQRACVHVVTAFLLNARTKYATMVNE
jgi:hypothetical protein